MNKKHPEGAVSLVRQAIGRWLHAAREEGIFVLVAETTFVGTHDVLAFRART